MSQHKKRKHVHVESLHKKHTTIDDWDPFVSNCLKTILAHLPSVLSQLVMDYAWSLFTRLEKEMPIHVMTTACHTTGFAVGNDLMIVRYSNDFMDVFDLKSGRLSRSLRDHCSDFRRIAIVNDFLFVIRNSEVAAWQLTDIKRDKINNRKRFFYPRMANPVEEMCVRGNKIFILFHSLTVCCFSILDGKCKQKIKTKFVSSPESFALSANTTSLYIARYFERCIDICMFDLKSGRQTWNFSISYSSSWRGTFNNWFEINDWNLPVHALWHQYLQSRDHAAYFGTEARHISVSQDGHLYILCIPSDGGTAMVRVLH